MFYPITLRYGASILYPLWLKKRHYIPLSPIEDFKALAGVDDREDKTARFCLLTATLTIEQYCKRKLIKRKHIETLEFPDDLYIPLREYPVSEILAVYLLGGGRFGKGELLEPDFYFTVPDSGVDNDFPIGLEFYRVVKRSGCSAVRVFYYAGYELGKIPADLSSACMELASWNINRYRSKQIGMASNVRGKGRDGLHFESSIPENVRALLEPYRRKTI
jgi:hypothetical protein